MHSFLRAAIVCGCFCGFSLAVLADGDPQHPPAEAFGALPAISDPVLSPDGHHLAIIQPVHGRPTVVIYELPVQAGKTPAILASDQWVVTRILWAKNDRLIVVIKDNRTLIDGGLSKWERAISVGVDGKNPLVLMENVDQSAYNPDGASINDIALDDPDQIYMPLYTGDASEFDDTVQKVDVHDGMAREMTRGTEYTERWLMDGHGQLVARVDFKPVSMTDELYTYHGFDATYAGTFPASGDKDTGLYGLSADGKALVMDRFDEKRMHILERHDLASGKETPLFSAPGYDVDSPLYDTWTQRVIGAAYADDKWEYYYFDPNREALQRGLEKSFAGASVVVVSSDLAGDKVIVEVDAPSATPSFLLLDSTGVKSIGHTYPGLTGVTLGEMKSYPYKARDGLDIPAYLTLPPGKAAKNLPLVVMPHGGPDARDVQGFDWWVQFMANRGYAVLQPEYRGSSGYGRKFTEAGLKQWGLKMQDDITDGVKKTIADGIADPKRICIVGASYGGYAALAGGAFTPDLYACVISFAGISDLPRMLHTEHRYNGKQASSFWETRIGSLDENDAQIKATSPAFHADQFRAPVLLMHGEGDTTVYMDQSEEMNSALETAGKTVTFVRLPGSDHYLSLAETRIKVLQETEQFLDKYIGH
jgi:dipeptidyl aminopeptidase/acylaminoacyl peptidase